MQIRKLFAFLILSGSLSLSAIPPIKGKKYKTRDGVIVTVEGSCKEVFGIEGLVKSGKVINTPGVYIYYTKCAQESGCKLTDLTDNLSEKGIKNNTDPKYHGTFYYVNSGFLSSCVHETWLTEEVE